MNSKECVWKSVEDIQSDSQWLSLSPLRTLWGAWGQQIVERKEEVVLLFDAESGMVDGSICDKNGLLLESFQYRESEIQGWISVEQVARFEGEMMKGRIKPVEPKTDEETAKQVVRQPRL